MLQSNTFKLKSLVSETDYVKFVKLPSQMISGDLDVQCQKSVIMGWGDQTARINLILVPRFKRKHLLI